MGISLIIAAELENQKQIWIDGGGTEKEFQNDFGFKVSNGLYFPKDIAKFPLLNVYFEKCENRDENDNFETNLSPYMLNLDMYVFRKDAEQENGDLVDGSNGADHRLNYFMAQVYRTMEAQVNHLLGDLDEGDVESFHFRGWKKDVNHPNAKALSYDIVPLFARMNYEIKICEEKLVNEGDIVNEIMIALELDEKATEGLLISGVNP